MNNERSELVVQNNNAVVMPQAQRLTAQEIRANVNLIQEVMLSVMKQDTHFGIIPGCKEPTLYKAGAEKIMATFRLAADPEFSDLSTDDECRYIVKVRMITINGEVAGVGIGECSSSEEKYKWRKAVCKEEFEETPEDRRRKKWMKGFKGRPAYQVEQVRTNIPDIRNTILKMAKKRALIDGVLTATAASDCFSQDIEDLPPEIVAEMTDDGNAPNYVKEMNQASVVDNALVESLTKIAKAEGMKGLLAEWKDLTEDQRASVGQEFGKIKKIAESAK